MGTSHGSPRSLRISRTAAALLLATSLSACVGAPTSESERAVRQVWDEYLMSKNGQFAANAGTLSPLWSASEQAQWPMYDLAGFYLPNDAVAEVLSVTPVNAAVDTAYRIVTRFWPKGPTPRDSAMQPVLTMTVYARRERRRWVLANALAYATSAWVRETRGRITYRVAPALRFDASKAERAAAFVDSLAAAFDVPAPKRIDYYVAESVDQAMEILGVVVAERFGPGGGFAKPVNLQVFSGIPALGENYRHELAHVVLMPIMADGPTTLLASEGVPTWLGGRGDRDYHESVRQLASQLRASPAIDLNAIVYDLGVSPDIRNVAGAVLAELVHESGGVGALREYLRSRGHEIPAVLERVLQRPWADIAVDWRLRVEQIAAHP